MSKGYYPEVNPNPDFAALEESVLAYWEKNKLFAASVENRPAKVSGHSNEYIFYDGPPFANGLPHYGHLLTGFVKDVFARYATMKGNRVERRFGWDCHGLPAEMGSEKELGISGRQAIMNFGIGKFNEYCRTSVMKYTHEWETYVTRQARWVDFQGDYKTMDKNFMESVLWAFKQIYDKGWVYEAYRVMPYSWAAETPLSNFETKLDNSYREREDKAAYVAFTLKEKPKNAPNGCSAYKIIAWTTTPWTLPSNLALAVGDKVQYEAIVNETTNVCYIFASKAYGELKKDLGIRLLKTAEEETKRALVLLDASSLIGLSYEPLFPYFDPEKSIQKAINAFRILDGSSFVTDTDGTGIVHMAPAFGEDDFNLCKLNDIGYYIVDALRNVTSIRAVENTRDLDTFVCPVDGQGKYTDAIFDLPDLQLRGLNVIAQTEGQRADEPYKPEQVKKFGLANLRIISWLKEHGKLIKQEEFKHNYPHCWRTDTPLIYRAMPSWYVEVTKFRDRAVELNKEINWIPAHVRDGQMGHMLATAPDWSISRNRFWGTPIPVWRAKSGKIIVIGSIAELEERSGKKVVDLHRPYIDEITITEGGEEYTRVEDVFDCWFESGSMPFAQVHYPFENKEWFEHHFPADFITEYVGQTRGWFNTLIMLTAAVFYDHPVLKDKPPFRNCICHGVVLDAETGLKYSKRLKNYKDPMEVINQFGADALRWLMISSPVMRGQDLMVDPDGKFIRDVVRLAIKPIWNAYNFFCLYANADGIKAKIAIDSQDVMDKYILSSCNTATAYIDDALTRYDTPTACDAFSKFFDILNNWYIRRSKERFWKSGYDADKQAAYDTLYTVLHYMCRAAAPLLPLTLEEVFRGLTGEDSVHLANYPKAADLYGDISVYSDEARDRGILSLDMDFVRDVCNAALAVRNKLNIRVRQPLNSLLLSGNPLLTYSPYLAAYISIIKDEVNIKEVQILQSYENFATRKVSINSAILGKRLPEKMKQIIPAAKKGEWELSGTLEICGELLEPDEYSVLLEPKPEYQNCAQAIAINKGLVILDTTITPELEAEGIARDLVRMIQQARKDADLNVSDRIQLHVDAPEAIAKAVATWQTYVNEQTLSVMAASKPPAPAFTAENTLDDQKITITFSLAA